MSLFLTGLASAGDQTFVQPEDGMGFLPIAPAPACGVEVVRVYTTLTKDATRFTDVIEWCAQSPTTAP